MFIFLFSLFVSSLVITFYIEQSFIFLYLALIFFSFYRYAFKKSIGLIVLSFLFLCMISKPSINTLTHIKGNVVSIDEGKAIIDIGSCYVQVKDEDNLLKAGQKIKAEFIESKIDEASNFNAFDYKHYLYGQDIYYYGTLSNIEIMDTSFSLYQWLYDCISSFDPVVRGYSFLFLLGIKEDYVKDIYITLGNLSIVHLFALSGMHIHLLFDCLEKLLARIKYKKYIILLLMGYYVFSLPLMISFKRAYLMKVITTLSNHKMTSLQAWAIALLYFIYCNPYVFYNISFLFSFALTFFVLILEKDKWMSFFLYLASIPLVLYQKSELSLFAFIYGLIFTPVIDIFYQWVLIHFCSFGLLSPLFKGMILAFENSIRIFDDLNVMIIIKKPSFFWIVVYYLILLLVIYNKQRGKAKYRLLVPLWIFILYLSTYFNPYGEVTMIDVGQGDCFLIREPFNQSVILIDTGGNYYQDVAVDTIIPYLKSKGIRAIDKIYISHDDFDHCGALESLTENFKVKSIQREFIEKDKVGNLELDMLAYPINEEETNDQSLVIYVKIGDLYYLFTGDISSDVEIYLQEHYPDIKVDVLKVSHHGSITSTSSRLLQWIHPSIALISVKENNIYRHPSSEVIKRLEKQSIDIYRTDLMGMVTIRYHYFGSSIFSKKDIQEF